MPAEELLDAVAAAVEAHAGLIELGYEKCGGHLVFCAPHVPSASLTLGDARVVLLVCGHLDCLPWWAWRARRRARALFYRAVARKIAHESVRLLAAAEPVPEPVQVRALEARPQLTMGELRAYVDHVAEDLRASGWA